MLFRSKKPYKQRLIAVYKVPVAGEVIKPEYLQKMITELPQDLLSVVVTQIDTEKFADALINKFPQLLAQFVAG